MKKPVMEMNCKRPLLSLQEMSFFRIITSLCNNRQLLKLILKCKLPEYYFNRLYARKQSEYAAVQAMAKKLLLQICNCVKFSRKVMELLWPSCYRIMVWRSIYAPSIESKFLDQFYWTDQGRIDSKRTAQYIIGNANIPIRERFVLACSMCLKEEIRDLWREMPNFEKMYFYAKNREITRPLLFFWAHTMIGKEVVLQQLVNDACACALENGFIDAVKYLFDVSGEDDRKVMAYSYSLKLFGKIDRYSYLEEDEFDLAYFLFFEMSEDCRQEVSGLFTLQLPFLLHFTEREHFLNALKKKLPSASVHEITILLHVMFLNYHLEVVKDDGYRQIIVDIWRTITPWKKTAISNSYTGWFYICNLIRDNFPFILRRGASKKIEEFTSPNMKSQTSVTPLVFHRDKWEFLHFLIEEVVKISALKSQKDRIMLHLKRSSKTHWNRFMEFIQEI